MIGELIDLCYHGNINKCYNMFNLVSYFCRRGLTNSNIHKTVKILAYRCGFSEMKIENKTQIDLCNMIIHSYQSPGLLEHVCYLQTWIKCNSSC